MVVIHLDYDAFYCSVIEAARPARKARPLAVLRKCNYEARNREIVSGEDLTQFRDASKTLYRFLRAASWAGRAERLGLDEVFLDVGDAVDWNTKLLNPHDLSNSFFCLSRDDPTRGFAFDATTFAGNTYPSTSRDISRDPLSLRLLVGSHLARHLRQELELRTNCTATAGISTNKLLAKLAGTVKKPNAQTTLLPPYDGDESNVTAFVDALEIGQIPGIGFKLAQKVRDFVFQRPAARSDGLLAYGHVKQFVTAGDIRRHPDVSVESLQRILGGPGSPHGVGARVWGLIHGVDDTEVGRVRDLPRQISIEDSYIRLDTLEAVARQLTMLSVSLLRRMHLDLLADEDEERGDGDDDASTETRSPLLASSSSDQTSKIATESPAHPPHPPVPPGKKCYWLAHPRTLRLSTRPRGPIDPVKNTRPRTFARISRSAPLPNFVFNLAQPVEALAERLVGEALLPLFRRLHPEKSGWNLSLVNVAVTNMVESAGDGRGSVGRDIGSMFRRQEEALRAWQVRDGDGEKEEKVVGPAAGGVGRESGGDGVDVTEADPPDAVVAGLRAGDHGPHGAATRYPQDVRTGSEDLLFPGVSQDSRDDDDGDDDADVDMDTEAYSVCETCGAAMPAFAMAAHARFHTLEG